MALNADGQMALIALTPQNRLAFDFAEQGEEKLIIENVTAAPIAFKVKTTAPRSYLVRPSSDFLPQGGRVEITIILQPTSLYDEKGQRVDPTGHRFLVQATALAKGSTTNISKEEWTALKKDQIQEFKLAVADRRGQTGGGGESLQKKYDELVAYIFKLEQETIQLQEKVKTLKTKGDAGYQLWHVFAVFILAAILAQLPMFIK